MSSQLFKNNVPTELFITLLETNCIMAFDGSIVHTSWNHTDQWRYSSNIDIDESFWELS